MQPPKQQKFIGFLIPNSTPVPDQLFDELLTLLSGNEIKVLLYIIRRTFGFRKKSDTISLNQMLHGLKRRDGSVLDGGVGLSKPTLLKALQNLIKLGIVVREKRVSHTKGSLPSRYTLKFADGKANDANPAGKEPYTRGGKEILLGGGKAVLPPTTNRITRNLNNVVVQSAEKQNQSKIPKKQTPHIDYLIDEIAKTTGDDHSRGGFAKVGALLEDSQIFQILSELKLAQDVKNKGALFMSLAKQKIAATSPP